LFATKIHHRLQLVIDYAVGFAFGSDIGFLNPISLGRSADKEHSGALPATDK
jgi:hypothetical protein